MSSTRPASETTRTSAFWHRSFGHTPSAVISPSRSYARDTAREFRASEASDAVSDAPADASFSPSPFFFFASRSATRHALRRHPKVTTVGATPARFMRSYVANASSGAPPFTCASMSAVYVKAFGGPAVSSRSASANASAAAAAPRPSGAALRAAAIAPTYVRSLRGTPAVIISSRSARARSGRFEAAQAAMSVLYVIVSGAAERRPVAATEETPDADDPDASDADDPDASAPDAIDLDLSASASASASRRMDS